MNERTTFFISFCSFWSCGLRETSMMVDYTDFEDLKILREKKVCECFPSPCHHRERRNFLIIIIIIIIFRGAFKFLLCRNF
jgi:hypothetical protein